MIIVTLIIITIVIIVIVYVSIQNALWEFGSPRGLGPFLEIEPLKIGRGENRKGTNGVNCMLLFLLTEGSVGTPVKHFSNKCQGIPYSRSGIIRYLFSDHNSADPIRAGLIGTPVKPINTFPENARAVSSYAAVDIIAVRIDTTSNSNSNVYS